MFRSETPIPLTIPAGQTKPIELVMTNRVGGRFAQEATFYISVAGVLIEKSITLEGQAAPDPNPPPAVDGQAEDVTDIDAGEETGSSSPTEDVGIKALLP